jgi:hypothetical protein
MIPTIVNFMASKSPMQHGGELVLLPEVYHTITIFFFSSLPWEATGIYIYIYESMALGNWICQWSMPYRISLLLRSLGYSAMI